MHSLVIHMPTSTDRRQNVDTILRVLPGAEVIEAVDGHAASATTGVTIRDGDAHRPAYPFELLPGEIGCFLSHRKCWQHIVEQGWDWAFIAEDDLGLNMQMLGVMMELITRNATPESYIRIPPRKPEGWARTDDAVGELRLVTPRYVGLQTTLQVVGRDAAKRLLAVTETIDRPVDTLLQMHWITGQRMQSILPVVAMELDFAGAGSTVQQKKNRSLSAKLSREWSRATYRAMLKNYPQNPAAKV